MSSETILVTGGAGYIGSHACVALAGAGYDTVIIDNLINSKSTAVAAIGQITGKPVPFIEMDVRDAKAMDDLFKRYRFDACIHFAALKSVGNSVREPVSYYQNNLDALLTLLSCMDAHGVKRLVYSSSATVYGEAEPPVSETSPTGGCINPYGWTKYMSERIIADYAAANPEFSAALLRYFNPVGAHESGLLGEDPKDEPTNLMPIIKNAVMSGRQLKVFGNDYPTPDGTCIRDYIHVMDLAEGHVSALEYTASHRGAEAVNLGTGRGYSVLELISAYERANGVKAQWAFAQRRPGDAASSFADTEKAARLLGWRAKRGVEEMCKSAHKAMPGGEPAWVR